MGTPVRKLPIHAFLGEQESHEALTLPQVHGTGGSFNVWFDRFGRVTPILGYTRQSLSPFVVGGVSTILRGLYRYAIFQSPFPLTDVVLGFFDSVTGKGTVNGHYVFCRSGSRGADWETMLDFGTFAVGSQPDFAQLGTDVILAPPAYDGATFSQQRFNGTLIVPIQAPRMGVPFLSGGGAGIMKGTFTVRIVPVHSDNSRGIGSPLSNQVQLNNDALAINWNVDTHPLTVGYEVYCSTGSGKVLFFVGQTTALSMTIDLADADIREGRACEEHGDFPFVAAFVEAHGQRMWYGGIDLNLVTGGEPYPRRWYFSDPGRPESCYGFNFIDASDAENLGGVTTGSTGNFMGAIVHWFEDSVWTTSGTGRWIGDVIDYRTKRSNAKVGCLTHRAVARIPAGARYTDANGQFVSTSQVTLAYLTPSKDIRLFDGDGDTIVSFGMAKQLGRLGPYAGVRAFVLEDTDRGEYTWCFPSETATENDLAVTWNIRYGVWYARPIWQLACALPMIQLQVSVIANNDLRPNMILAGSSVLNTGGVCYRLWNGYLADGGAFNWQWFSKTLYGLARSGEAESASELMAYMKRFRWTQLLFKREEPVVGTVPVDVAWLRGDAADEDDHIGTVTVQVPETCQRRVQHLLVDGSGEFLHDQGMRLRIRGTSSPAL